MIATNVRIVPVLLLLSIHSMLRAQDQRNSTLLMQPAASSQTGTAADNWKLEAAKTGKADGMGNPTLGGERRPLYRLNRSDVVAVSFALSPELDQSVTVQPDGYITLKDAGSIFAQGLTLEEFRQAVLRAYTGYLNEPQVAVALTQFEHPYFVAGGEVGRPGKYELRAATSVIEAVAMAGGLTHDAKHSQVLVFRRVNDNLLEAHVFDLKKMLKGRSLNEVAEVQSGDLIFVPQNVISKIGPFISRPSLSMYVSPTQF